MKRLFPLLLSFGAIFNKMPAQVKPAVSSLQTIPGFNTEQRDAVVKYASDFPNGTQLSIAVLKNDTATFFGLIRENDTFRNLENHQSVFEIGSITKVFTSTLLVHCVQEGIVQLDRPIQEYFSFPLKAGEKDGVPVTLRTLSNHTSGLPRLTEDLMAMSLANFQNPYKNYGPNEMRKGLEEKMALLSTPGSKHQYSNFGAGLLAFILAQRSGKSFDQLLADKIFNPYEMNRSCADRNNLKGNLVPGLTAKGDTATNWDFDALKGAGAILSTTEDLSKFMSANFRQDSVLSFQREKTFSVSGKMDVALGWHILKPQTGGPWHWHNGGTGGYSSNMVMDVAKKSGIVILTNVSAFSARMANVESLCFTLMKMLE